MCIATCAGADTEKKNVTAERFTRKDGPSTRLVRRVRRVGSLFAPRVSITRDIVWTECMNSVLVSGDFQVW